MTVSRLLKSWAMPPARCRPPELLRLLTTLLAHAQHFGRAQALEFSGRADRADPHRRFDRRDGPDRAPRHRHQHTDRLAAGRRQRQAAVRLDAHLVEPQVGREGGSHVARVGTRPVGHHHGRRRAVEIVVVHGRRRAVDARGNHADGRRPIGQPLADEHDIHGELLGEQLDEPHEELGPVTAPDLDEAAHEFLWPGALSRVVQQQQDARARHRLDPGARHADHDRAAGRRAALHVDAARPRLRHRQEQLAQLRVALATVFWHERVDVQRQRGVARQVEHVARATIGGEDAAAAVDDGGGFWQGVDHGGQRLVGEDGAHGSRHTWPGRHAGAPADVMRPCDARLSRAASRQAASRV
jgi:hypothetical protein